MAEKNAPARIWATPTRETFEKPEWDRGEFYEDERHVDGLGVQYVRFAADALAEALKALLDENDAVQIADELEAERAAHAETKRERDEAMKALEPFANVAEHDIGEDEDDSDTFWPMSNARYSMAGRLRVGHLRAARRALEGGE